MEFERAPTIDSLPPPVAEDAQRATVLAPARSRKVSRRRDTRFFGSNATGVHPLTQDPFRLALMLLLIETLAKFTGFFRPLWGLHLAMFLFAFSFIYALIKPRQALDLKILEHRVPRLVVAQAILACASAVFGISQGSSAHFITSQYWKTIAFALILIASVRGVADTRRMVKATALAGFILAFASVFIIHISKDSGTGTYDANDVGLIAVMTLPLGLLILQTSKGLWRFIAVAGIGLIGMTIPLTASRGAFVGTVAVGIALLLFLPGVSVLMRVLVPAAVVGTIALVAPASYWDSMTKAFTNPTSDYNWDAGQGRKELAKRGIGYMLRYPIFGIGIGNFPHAEVDPEMSEFAAHQAEIHAGYRPSAPHNTWIEAGAETGIPGAIVWVALVVGTAWGVVRLRKTIPRSWAKSSDPDERFIYLATLYVPISTLGFAVCATFVSFAWLDETYVLPAIAMGVQKAFAQQMARSAARQQSPHALPAGQRRFRRSPMRQPPSRQLPAPSPTTSTSAGA